MDRNNKIQSPTLHKLLNMDDMALTKRYLKKKDGTQGLLKDAVEHVLNLKGEDGNFKYGAIALLCSGEENKNLTFIYDQIFTSINPMVISKGYQLKIENIIADLNEIFNDYAIQVLKVKDVKDKVVPFVKEIVNTYFYDVLTDKVLATAFGHKITLD